MKPLLTTSQTLDLDVVQELVTLAATVEGSFLKETLGSFQGRCTSFLNTIDEGIAREDETKVANAAHTLAGSAAILGASALRACLVQIEDEARTGRWDGVNEKRAVLDSLCDNSLRELKKAFG